MDAALQSQMTVAAFVCSALALCFSLVAAFPGLKPVLAAIRDGVLWFCLFLVLGGVAFVVWQQVQQPKSPSPASFAIGQASRVP
jgi:hypothetical protein